MQVDIIDTLTIQAYFIYYCHKIMCVHAAVDCDCTAIDNEGKTALHWTVTNKDPSCILALVDAYPPLLNRRYMFTNDSPSKLMIKIVHCHHYLPRDMNNNTILHLVAASGAAHLVDALLRIEGY